MPLWNKTDTVESRPKWIDLATYPAGTELLFVDETEAQQESNKAIGLTGAGWWLYRTYTDAAGATRHKAELLVAMSVPALAAGDSDTLPPPVITITVQPAASAVIAPNAVVLTVGAAVTLGATLAYQWQKAESATPTVFADVVGATTNTLTIGPTSDVTDNGDVYRVVVSADGGATSVTSADTALVVTAI